jgi:hypothetical protein
MLIMAKNGADGDVAGALDDAGGKRLNAALLNEMAVSEGWWARQCSWLTGTLTESPWEDFTVMESASRDRTPESQGLESNLCVCVSC